MNSDDDEYQAKAPPPIVRRSKHRKSVVKVDSAAGEGYQEEPSPVKVEFDEFLRSQDFGSR